MKANPTIGEQAFSMLITALGVDSEFQQQAIVAGYILDFYHVGLRKDGKRCKPFAVEIDGFSHNSKKAREADAYRTGVLERLGISVIRFTNRQVQTQRSSVAHAVMMMRETRRG